MAPNHLQVTIRIPLSTIVLNTYRIVGFCREDYNLTIGSIRDIKIRDHFIHDILYLTLY